MYTEKEMAKRIERLKSTIRLYNGFDILLTHSPAKDFGDLEDLPHRGYECFNELLLKYKPRYMIHGHVHGNYGQFERVQVHPSGTIIINAYDNYNLTVRKDEHPEEGRTGSPLYDLYKSLSMGRRRYKPELHGEENDD